MSPYNILSDIKSGRIQVKSMDSATILFFKCQRWDYNTIILYRPYKSEKKGHRISSAPKIHSYLFNIAITSVQGVLRSRRTRPRSR